MTEYQIHKAVELRRLGKTLASIAKRLGTFWEAVDVVLVSPEARRYMKRKGWHVTPYRHRVVPTSVPRWKDRQAFLEWLIDERRDGRSLLDIAELVGCTHSALVYALRTKRAHAIMRKRGLAVIDGSEIVELEEVVA